MKWISINDAVPPDSRLILIHYYSTYSKVKKHSHIEIGSRCLFKNGKVKWRSHKGGYIYNEYREITHWAKLPEPPNGED